MIFNWLDMKRGRKLVVAFLLFITVEALVYTIYSSKEEPEFQSDPLPHSDHVPLSKPKLCRPSFFKESQRNLNRVRGYPMGNSGPYLQPLGLSGNVQNASVDVPIVVTAASSNHFSEVKAFFKHLENSVFPFTGRLKVIFFDLGLTRGHLLELMNMCKCETRHFSFSAFPNHVAMLWGYAWKPLIIQMMLVEYGFVMWMDSSVTIKDGSNFPSALRAAKTNGISISWSGKANPTSLAASTHTQTFDMLREKPCTFRDSKEFFSGFIIIYRTQLVEEAIMRPWISCGLTSGCMVMNIQRYTACTKNDIYAECHRFDQSVLSIILNRLFHGRIHDIDLPVAWTKCGGRNSISYLPSFVNDFIYDRSKSSECKGVR